MLLLELKMKLTEIQIPKMIEICKKYNVLMKSHNTDYLSDEALSLHPRLGLCG